MPYDLKYGRVTLERQRNIADDELVVIFRAADATVPELLTEYGRLCHAAGSPPNHLAGIADAQRAVETWQAEHGAKVPESKGYRA